MTDATQNTKIELSVVKLSAAVGAAVVLTAGLLAGVLALVDRPEWWRGLAPATISSALAAAVSLVPMIIGIRFGLHGAAAGFFAAGILRAVISISACLVAALVGGYPLVPTMLLMVPFYFAVLGVEAILLGRAMWPVRMG